MRTEIATSRATRRASVLVQELSLKATAVTFVVVIFFGALRYASSHVWNPAAPLRPARAEDAAGATVPSAALRGGGLGLPFVVTTPDIQVTPRTALTRTRQS